MPPQTSKIPEQQPGPGLCHTWRRIVKRARGAVADFETAPAKPPASKTFEVSLFKIGHQAGGEAVRVEEAEAPLPECSALCPG